MHGGGRENSSVDAHFPGVRLKKAGDQPEGRRLAAAARAEERNEFASLHRQIEIDDTRGCAETLVEPDKFKKARGLSHDRAPSCR